MWKDYKAFCALYYALDANDFNRISSYEIAKKVCDTVITIYELTSQGTESKISIYVHQYKFSKRLPSEGVMEMYIRFTDIINNLKFHVRVYSNEENMTNFMRNLLSDQK